MNTKTCTILPAVLERTLEAIQEQIRSINASPRIHLDIIAGIPEAEPTWPYRAAAEWFYYKQLVLSGTGSHIWGDSIVDVHLMMGRPDLAVRPWVALGARRIIMQAEAPGAFEALKRLQPYRREKGVESVISVAPTDEIEAVEPFLDLIDGVLVMGIEKIGAQGRPFDGRALELLRSLKLAVPRLCLGIDGGMTAGNIADAKAAGADWIAVGSAICKQTDPAAAYRELQAMVA